MPEPTNRDKGAKGDPIKAATESLDLLRNKTTNVPMPDISGADARKTDSGLSNRSRAKKTGSSHSTPRPEVAIGEPRQKMQTRAEAALNLVEPLKPHHQCPVCTQVLQFPVQFDQCEHRCCSACLSELLRVAPKCPMDGKHVNRDKVFVDKNLQREIEGLQVKCSFKSNGCNWVGTLKAHKEHLEDCEFKIEQCPRGCGLNVEKKKLVDHLDHDCPKRPVSCSFCEEEITFEDESVHLKDCSKYPIPCPNNCRVKDLPREQMEEHLENECIKQKKRCPFAPGGCMFKGDKKELDRHCEKEMVDHLTQMCSVVMKQKQTMDIIEKKMNGHEEKLQTAVGKVETLDKMYGAQLLWKIENYKQKMFEAKSGTKPTIFSPPFLTSRHGYKMALSACLFGDGKLRGKFMSVFCCLCKGEYDALLTWPFSHKVTFTIIDQCQDPEARRNISYTVKPNVCKENKPFLGRPVADRNASFGAQKFVELELLKSFDYIRDDTMFIKVEVDSSDSPNV